MDASAIRKSAEARFAEYRLDRLPAQLRRNSLDYYYLSVWPGLRDLGVIEQVRLPPRPEVTRSAYFHLPFCSGLCSFCSYFVVVSKDSSGDPRIGTYLELMLAEVDLYQERTRLDLEYVYFGGGTPSVMPPEALAGLLEGLRSRGVLGEKLIGTIEVHPELFDDRAAAAEFLDVIASFGIDRVSFGLQTTDGNLLRRTNRRHLADFLAAATEMVRSRQLAFNLDLMYGLPGGTLDGWLESLRVALDHDPDSISTYFTFIDFGTALWRQVQNGTVRPAGHAELQLQHLAAQILLEGEGYVELPNDFWTKPAAAPTFRQRSLPSAANSVGLGAGAYGYFPTVQHFNHFDLDAYTAAIKAAELPLWRAATLDDEESLRRDVMFSLKNEPELRLELFTRRYGDDVVSRFADQFRLLDSLDLISADDEAVRLSAKGRLMVEEIASLFAARPDSSAAEPASGAERFLLRKHNYAPTYGSRDVDSVADS